MSITLKEAKDLLDVCGHIPEVHLPAGMTQEQARKAVEVWEKNKQTLTNILEGNQPLTNQNHQ